MDCKLSDKYGLQIEGRTEKGNPKPATHPNTEIAEIDCNTSTSIPLCLTAPSRHLGETIHTINQPKFKAGHSKPLRRTSASSWQTGRPVTANRSAPGFGRRAGLATVWHTLQVTPPLSGVEQADLMDDIVTIFNDLMKLDSEQAGRSGRSTQRTAAERRTANGDGHEDDTHQKRTRRRGGRRGETCRAARRTAREEAAQARASIKEATDFEEAPKTDNKAPRTVAETDNKALRTVAETDNKAL